MAEDELVRHSPSWVESDRYDRYLWEEIRQQEFMATLEAAGLARVPQFDRFLFDLFAVLYKYRPQIRMQPPASEFAGPAHPQPPLGQLLLQVVNQPIYERLRPHTCLNDAAAALAVYTLGGYLLANWPDSPAEAADRDSGGTPSPRRDSRSVETAMQRTLAEMARFEEGKALWGDQTGQWEKLPWQEKWELAQRLIRHPKLGRIADRLGRLRRIPYPAALLRQQESLTEVFSITQGNALDRLLPSELANLAHPVRRRLFLRNWAEGQLLQYELQRPEPLGRGPLICCLDNSGSMAGLSEVWSKAIALSLLDLAARQKRPYACVHFASAHEVETVEVRGQAEVRDRLAIAEPFFNGGTDFEAPLREALDVARRSGFAGSDLVLITDGEAEVSEAFLSELRQMKQQSGLRIVTILIDCSDHTDHAVRSFSDEVVPVSVLTQADEVTVAQLWKALQR